MTSGFSLEKSSLLPDFDFELFPFIIDYGTTGNDGHSLVKSHSFNLVNIRSGRIDTLINGSAQNFVPQQAILLTKNGEGRFTMDFCTVRHNSTTNLYEQSWHQMSFNTDFTDILKKHSRISKLNSIQECVEMECLNDKLKSENETQKQEITAFSEIFEHLCNTNDGLRE